MKTDCIRRFAGFGALAPMVVGSLAIACCLAWALPAWGQQAPTYQEKLSWQIGLDREGFSPGLIDARVGAKTLLATREFQRAHGLSETGTLDDPTRSALKINPSAILAQYTVTAEDLASVGPAPKDWLAKSRLARLNYESLTAALAERFHCTQGLLEELNPGRDLSALKARQTLWAPAIDRNPPAAQAERVEINLTEKVVRALDRQGRVVAMFHCSVAADKAKLPSGSARVTVISENPTYLFDPDMWPEVKGITDKLVIPPGPRNPVGLCWIGLSLPGYGMHGCPAPELIGKTGSHGCFRLANWDALRLGKMVRVGTPVTFAARQGSSLAAAGGDSPRLTSTAPPVPNVAEPPPTKPRPQAERHPEMSLSR